MLFYSMFSINKGMQTLFNIHESLLLGITNFIKRAAVQPWLAVDYSPGLCL